MSGERRDFDAAAGTWDENPARVKLAHDVARAILETLRPGPETDVLDIGCGTGLLTLRLRPEVRMITGVDSSAGMLAVLQEKIRAGNLSRVRACPGNLERGELPDGQYDLAVSSMTFHHIRDVGLLVGRIAEVLRPQGRIAIADLDPEQGRFHESDDGVFHNGFDRCILKKELEENGFTTIRNRTAAIIHKPSPSGEMRAFTVFLMTGIRED